MIILRFLLYTLVATTVFYVSSVRAETGTIGELRNDCKQLQSNDPNALDVGYCLGFLSGLGALLQFNCFDENYRGNLATMPSNTGQRVQAFLNWADDHPEQWGNSEATVAAVLALGLPCDRTQ